MTGPLVRREVRAAASILVGLQRGGFGLRESRVLGLLESQVPEYLAVFCQRASAACDGLLYWERDSEQAEVLVLTPHAATAATDRHDRSVPTERQKGGLGFALAILLFLYYRRAVIGAPATTTEDLIRQFQQSTSHLEVRIGQHLEWLAAHGLIAPVDGRADQYTITAAGRAVFPLPLLCRIIETAQGTAVPPEAVQRFFRVSVSSAPEAEMDSASPDEPPPLNLAEKRALSRIIAASQDGTGLPVDHVQALIGVRDLVAVRALLDRANSRYEQFVQFIYDEPDGVAIALSPLEDRPATSARETDAGAAILMYLYYALGVSGDIDLPVPAMTDALAGLGRRVPHQLGTLEGRGLIRFRTEQDGIRRVGLTPTGRAVFPPWLYERLPARHAGGPVPVQEVTTFFRQHLGAPPQDTTPLPTQTRLFEE